jgi:aryl-alcohol dehydrogenase-like predicted oxidoreductase
VNPYKKRSVVMKYREFGKTGIMVSELIVGGGIVGGILILADDETKRAFIQKAIEGGVNWIDTSEAYGNGKSEENIGWLLKEIENQFYISTKVRLDNKNLKDIPGQIERALHGSLKRLSRESVDLYQLHNQVTKTNGTFRESLAEDEVLMKNGVADGLERMREQGLTRFIGLTATGDGSSLHRLVESRRFDSAQIYYNFLNPSAGRFVPKGWSAYDYNNLIDKCKKNGVAVMAIRVLAGGVVTSDTRTGREILVSPGSDVESDQTRAKMVREALGGEGNIAQTAIRYVLANQGVSTALVGFSELNEIDEAIEAVEMGPLSSSVIKKLDRLHDTDFGRI